MGGGVRKEPKVHFNYLLSILNLIGRRNKQTIDLTFSHLNLIGRRNKQTIALTFSHSNRLKVACVIVSSFKAHCRTERLITIEV